MNHVPLEILIHIFSFIHLDHFSLYSFERVCKDWECLIQLLKKDRQRSFTVAFLGPSSSGKTTIIGKMLYNLGYFKDVDISQNAKSYEKILSSKDDPELKEYIKYGLLIDKQKDERKEKRTLHLHRVTFGMDRKFGFGIIDVSGHLSQLKNAVRSISLADFVVLVLSAEPNELKKSLANGSIENFLSMAYTMQTKRLSICINKMDKVEYSKSSYYKIAEKLIPVVKRMGFSENVFMVPTCMLNNENLSGDFHKWNLNWYKGHTLFQLLEIESNRIRLNTWEQVSKMIYNPEIQVDDDKNSFKKLVEGPLRIAVNAVYKLPIIGTIACGRIISGQCFVNQNITIEPTGFETSIKSIHLYKREVDKGVAGDYISLCLRNISLNVDPPQIYRGCVIGERSRRVIHETKSIQAKVVNIGNERIGVNSKPVMYIQSTNLPIKIKSIQKKTNTRTKKSEDNPTEIKKREIGMVSIVPLKPICVEPFADFPILGRFVLRGGTNRIIGAGIITSTTPKIKRKVFLHTAVAEPEKKKKVIATKKDDLPELPVYTHKYKDVWNQAKFMRKEWNTNIWGK